MTNQQKHPRRLWVFLLAVAATILAGCGSSTNNAGDATSSSASTTTSVVTQVVTKTAKARSAPPRKAKPRPKPAPAPAATSTPAPAGPIMPNVAGENLDTATGELDTKGIQYALNSNGKHVILKFDWGVCSTSPAAGQPVTGVVLVNLGHFTCMR
jgi:outer membrane murein-binding lipoprotein Lpp